MDRACAVLALLAMLFLSAGMTASTARASGSCDDGPLDGITISPGAKPRAKARKDSSGSDYFARFAGADRVSQVVRKPARAAAARPGARATRIQIRRPAVKPAVSAQQTRLDSPPVTVWTKPTVVARPASSPVAPIAKPPFQQARFDGPPPSLKRSVVGLPHVVPRPVTPDLRTAVPGVIALVLLTAVAGFVGYRRAQPVDTGHASAVRRFLR